MAQEKVKKIVVFLVIFSLLVGNHSVSAQNNNLPSPGITPDSLFYFFDIFWEKITLFLAFSPEKRSEKAFQYTKEKLAEIKLMAEQNKPEELKKSIQYYKEYLSLAINTLKEAKQKGKNIEKLISLSAERLLRDTLILSELLQKAVNENNETLKKILESSIDEVHKSFEVVVEDKELNEKLVKELEKLSEKLKEKSEEEKEFTVEEMPLNVSGFSELACQSIARATIGPSSLIAGEEKFQKITASIDKKKEDKIAIGVVGNKLRIISSASVEIGISEPSYWSIISNDNDKLTAFNIENTGFAEIFHSFVLKKKTGFAVWTKNVASISTQPHALIIYFQCY